MLLCYSRFVSTDVIQWSFISLSWLCDYICIMAHCSGWIMFVLCQTSTRILFGITPCQRELSIRPTCTYDTYSTAYSMKSRLWLGRYLCNRKYLPPVVTVKRMIRSITHYRRIINIGLHAHPAHITLLKILWKIQVYHLADKYVIVNIFPFFVTLKRIIRRMTIYRRIIYTGLHAHPTHIALLIVWNQVDDLADTYVTENILPRGDVKTNYT